MSLETTPGTPKSIIDNNTTVDKIEMSPELIIDHGHEPDTIGNATHAESIQPTESSDSKNFNLTPKDLNNTDF